MRTSFYQALERDSMWMVKSLFGVPHACLRHVTISGGLKGSHLQSDFKMGPRRLDR